MYYDNYVQIDVSIEVNQFQNFFKKRKIQYCKIIKEVKVNENTFVKLNM